MAGITYPKFAKIPLYGFREIGTKLFPRAQMGQKHIFLVSWNVIDRSKGNLMMEKHFKLMQG